MDLHIDEDMQRVADCRNHNRDCSQLAQLSRCFISTQHQRLNLVHALPYLRDFSIETEVGNERHCERVLADDLDPGVPGRRRGGCVEIKLAGHAWGLKGDMARDTAVTSAGGNGPASPPRSLCCWKNPEVVNADEPKAMLPHCCNKERFQLPLRYEAAK